VSSAESPLHRLDEAVVPAAAQRLRRTVAAVRRWGGAPEAAGTAAHDAVRRQPALAGSIAVVLLAAVAVAVAGGPGPQTGSGGGAVPPPPPVTVASLGPVPGTSVAAYLRTAALDLRRVAQTAQGRATYAVVDLAQYLTPTRVAEVLAGVDAVRAYVRVPDRRLPTQVHSVPLQGLPSLVTGVSTTAAVAAATARSFAVLLAHLHPRSPADRKVKAGFVERWHAAVAEASALEHPARCECVFAVVVHADITRLAALTRIAAVRVVDPAPPTVGLEALSVYPLEPQVTAIVPRTGLLGG
jgi:hypothetical protein